MIVFSDARPIPKSFAYAKILYRSPLRSCLDDSFSSQPLVLPKALSRPIYSSPIKDKQQPRHHAQLQTSRPRHRRLNTRGHGRRTLHTHNIHASRKPQRPMRRPCNNILLLSIHIRHRGRCARSSPRASFFMATSVHDEFLGCWQLSERVSLFQWQA